MTTPAPTLYACSLFTETGDCAAWAAVPVQIDWTQHLPTFAEGAALGAAMFLTLGTITALKLLLVKRARSVD